MTIRRSRFHAGRLLAAALLLTAPGGCRNKGPDRPGEPGSPGTPTATSRPDDRGTGATGATGAEDPDLAILTVTAVDIDARLAAMCQLPESKVYFKFDSANLNAETKERLDQLATCATTGAASGKELRIVGRTDPVGSDAYNQQLGMSRAAAVGEYLRTKGVQRQRVDIESLGEQGAPADPRMWPQARRVTIRLQES